MAYLPEERETVIHYDELENAWTFETSVRRHITKIEKRLELYEVLDEELDSRGARIYIRVKMLAHLAAVSPFAKTRPKISEEQRKVRSERAKSILSRK